MTHPPQTTDTPQRDTTNLASCVTKSSFLHIQDALAIGKIALWVGKYQSGRGTQSHATGYIDADTARVVLWDLLARGGLPEKLYPGQKFEAFGGSTKDGQVIARVVRIAEIPTHEKAPIEFSVSTGPGRRLDSGAIQPTGQLERVACFLSVLEARKLAASVLDELQAARIVARLKEHSHP